jgi:GNAT superfamily N-acetyltransferase
LAWAFALTKRNMQAMYEACPRWGWNDGRKRGELEDGDTRVIVAAAAAGAAPPPLLPPPAAGPAAEVSGEGAALRNDGSDPAAAAAAAAPRAPLAGDPGGAGTSSGGVAPGAPLAFVSLRFEAEGDEAVLYVYELQVEGAAQGAGLGRLLMAAAEREARRHGMARVMLTVFQGNAAARAMYLKLGYVRDEGSPAGERQVSFSAGRRRGVAAAPASRWRRLAVLRTCVPALKCVARACTLQLHHPDQADGPSSGAQP